MVKQLLVQIFVLFFLVFGIAKAESTPSKDLPYYNEITKILDRLEYSGFPVMVKPQISLALDFDKKTWTLRNIHQYDTKGNIILEQDRYGLCAELSTYLYEKLQGVVSPQFEIKFTMATEKGFFPTYESNHIVLLMVDRESKTSYLMDPSFHRYGKVKDFNQYEFLTVQDSLSFVKDKTNDISFQVNQAMPLFIKDDMLLSFSVTSINGKFDKDNFLFVVGANQRDQTPELNILLVGKYNNQVESYEAKNALGQLLTPQEMDMLQKKLEMWMRQI